MNQTAVYRQNAAHQWTRIDMLIAIYESLEETLQQGIEHSGRSEQPHIPLIRLKAQRLVLALLDGIDPHAEGVTRQISALLLHVLDRLGEPTLTDWQHAAAIIGTLAEGFREIRMAARELESQGKVPPLMLTSCYSLSLA